MDNRLVELLKDIDLIVLSEWRMTPDKFFNEDIIEANITPESSEYIGDVIELDSWTTMRADDGCIMYYLPKWDKVIRFCFNNHAQPRSYYQILESTSMEGIPYPIYEVVEEII
jgi:predicted nucleotidyltransferase